MNKRMTIQRQIVLDTVKALDHPAANSVYEEVRIKYPHISLGTVYRNLTSLCDDRELLRLTFPNSPDRFDPNLHPHYHLLCRRCGGVSDVDMAYLSEIDRAASEKTGLSIEGHMVCFFGICGQCRDGPDAAVQ
ncbi:MAG: transcriptional repressor [Clostridia bacterium]|nr:transcriptional repressor [Clostridia bacterium]